MNIVYKRSKEYNQLAKSLLDFIKSKDKAYGYPAYRERRNAIKLDVDSIVIKALHKFYVKD